MTASLSATDRDLLATQGVIDDTRFADAPLNISSLEVTVGRMPLELVPEPLRPWVADVCERMNVPVEMIAVPMMVAASTLVGRNVRIRPKRRDEWTVVPNLWGCIVGRPAMLKSPALAQALAPLRRIEERLLVNFQDGQLQQEVDRRMLEIEISSLEQAAKKSGAPLDSIRETIYEKKLAFQALEVNAPRRSTNDSTTEKLGELLRENPRGLLLDRDELIGLLKNLDKPGREGDRQFYLESWNGDGWFTFDRIGRGTIRVPNCVSVIGTATPGALREYVRAALIDGAGADGLMQRLQLLVWPDDLPDFRNVDRAPNEEARRRVSVAFEALDTLTPQSIGAQCAPGETWFLRFSEAAQSVFDAWRNNLERRLRDEFAHEPALEAHLAKYRSLMPSLALLFHLIGNTTNEEVGPLVGEGNANLAADWCAFLERHARKLYAEGGSLFAARCLADHIEDGEIESGDTQRDIYRKGWKGLQSPERVAAALQILEEAHWLVLERVTQHRSGRPGSPHIILHPLFAPRVALRSASSSS